MDVDRSVASATARSSGNFDRSGDANSYQYASTRNGRSGKVSKFRSLFQVDLVNVTVVLATHKARVAGSNAFDPF